ncbi:leucine-rich repeat domain-containing protein [Segatella copri]|uniref:leucine-rich repeat domain-containing protein n=1 Tax=Segatella copri TaxID=165179 RepID=UPI00294B7460|nr:leucine-rich repeat domain-containing protein [Segatella copri]
MRTFTLKGLFVTAVFMLLGCLAIHAADGDLITKQITIKLEEAGTLPSKIGDTKKYKITNLKIMGEINGTDLRFIREMAGCDYKGMGTEGKLVTLDLSEAKIVEGGDFYYGYYDYYDHHSYYYTTSDDVIGDYAFSGCSSLTSLTLPSSVTSIGGHAFEKCSGLTSLTLPSSVTSIGEFAFRYCSGLTSLTIPSGVTTIDYYAFADCRGLTSLTLPSSVTSIGGYAFAWCSGLTSLTLHSSVTSIGDYAFAWCSGLTSLTLPSSVTSIGGHAFESCSGLTSLTLPSSVTEIDWSAFERCNNLKECNCLLDSDLETCLAYSHDDWTKIPVDEIKYYHNGQELTKLEIPSGVDKIGSYSFYKGVNLTSLTLPSSVTSIGSSAFEGCSGLTSVYVSWKSPLSIFASTFSSRKYI